MAQKNLHVAKQQKLDEFYTQIGDIERECMRYKDQFRGKVIFLNCDDPVESNFWRHFALNYTRYGLKKLVATHFDREKSTYKLELTGDMNEDGTVNNDDIIKTPLKQNGDFRSPECIEILKEADIVVTNPPFSLFREYVAQLAEYNKKFLVIGNKNSITHKEIFKLIKDNKLWTGYRNFSGGMWFYTTDDNENYDKIIDGRKMKNVPSIWYTNLDTSKRHENLVLYKKFEPSEYPKYDNFDAIEVSKVADIPVDYSEPMGVPVTFFDKYNPNQFEILGNLGSYAPDGYSLSGAIYINGKKIFKRILIKRRQAA
ncbi:MAG: adenine-specific methyltransferase EcoRI family protein [Candidatus Saccharimonadales bacterium]